MMGLNLILLFKCKSHKNNASSESKYSDYQGALKYYPFLNPSH